MKYDTVTIDAQIDALREAREAVQARLESLNAADVFYEYKSESATKLIKRYDDTIEAALIDKEIAQRDFAISKNAAPLTEAEMDAEAEADREQHLDQAALRGGL
jgi:hypothetical protein